MAILPSSVIALLTRLRTALGVAAVSGDILDPAVLDIPFSFPLDSAGLVEFHIRAVKPAVTAIYGRYGNQVVAATPVLLPAILPLSSVFGLSTGVVPPFSN